MNFGEASAIILKKLVKQIGWEVNEKGKVKFSTLQGKYVAFLTSDGYGFAPENNPEDIHWTIHTGRRFSKETAWINYILPIFQRPNEFHEKVQGKTTKKFKWKDGYKPLGAFVKDRRKKYKKQDGE
ncbi:MAG: hypothetical protein ACFFDI_27685 [Promethearchaeota archaeon]